MRFKSLLFISVLVFLPVAAWGETHTAASCSLADVQTAYDAASEGDTVIIPAGECVWASSLTVSKAITIKGAGSDAGGTKLIASGKMTNGFFNITGITSTEQIRIYTFFFEMTNWTSEVAIRTNNVSLDNLRIDHNTFNHGGKAHIVAVGVKGVIDHNYFINGNKSISYSAGSNEQANESWNSLEAGTSDALFIEDNHFIDDVNYTGNTYNEKIGTFNGGKLVVRHNTFTQTQDYPSTRTFSPIMTHGSAPGGAENGYWQQGVGARRGQSVVEIYDNIMQGKRIDFPVIVRGSTNLIFNNTIIISGANTPLIKLKEEEYDAGGWAPFRTDWPAEDQVHNTFIWNNTHNGVEMDATNVRAFPDDPAPNEKIKENRDYFLHEPQATGGKEIFTGANGASDTAPTNGFTFPTLGTMVFSASGANAHYPYVPYEYPHPLTVELSPPKNARIE
ncbi:MAG: hypothetical protein GY797_25715 [Deltaproteobacteria bacterium]|nr:hypothetical protein [Deltaproteobacteria bacterium]